MNQRMAERRNETSRWNDIRNPHWGQYRDRYITIGMVRYRQMSQICSLSKFSGKEICLSQMSCHLSEWPSFLRHGQWLSSDLKAVWVNFYFSLQILHVKKYLTVCIHCKLLLGYKTMMSYERQIFHGHKFLLTLVNPQAIKSLEQRFYGRVIFFTICVFIFAKCFTFIRHLTTSRYSKELLWTYSFFKFL